MLPLTPEFEHLKVKTSQIILYETSWEKCFVQVFEKAYIYLYENLIWIFWIWKERFATDNERFCGDFLDVKS